MGTCGHISSCAELHASKAHASIPYHSEQRFQERAQAGIGALSRDLGLGLSALLQEEKRRPNYAPGTRGNARAQPFPQEEPQCGPGNSLHMQRSLDARQARSAQRGPSFSAINFSKSSRGNGYSVKPALCVLQRASQCSACVVPTFEAQAAHCQQRTCKTAQPPRRPPVSTAAPGSSQRRSECRTSQCVCRPRHARWRGESLCETRRTDDARCDRHR